MKEFETIANLLRTALPTHGDRPIESVAQTRLLRLWNEKLQLGAVNLHSFPLLFTSGRLVVFVESSAWGAEIRHQTQRLTQMLAGYGVHVHSVTVKNRPPAFVKPHQPKPTPKPTATRLSAENAAQIKHLAAQIRHPQLQQALLKLAEHALPSSPLAP